MKKIIILILLINISQLFSQKSIVPNTASTKLNFVPSFTLEQQFMIIKEFVKHYYGTAFKYSKELHTGQYHLELDKSHINIVDNTSKLIDRIQLITVKDKENNLILKVDTKDLERLVNMKDFYGHSQNKMNPYPLDSIPIIRNNILWDKVILLDDNIPSNEQKIFNKGFVATHLHDPNEKTAELFKFCQEGVIIPYGNGAHTKILAVDPIWSSVFYFDKDVAFMDTTNYLNGCYGESGNGKGQFMTPTGISLGREYSSGNYLAYPVYVADQNNNRVVTANFMVNQYSVEEGYFQLNSYKVLRNIARPYDVAFFKSDTSSNDKLWVSEYSPTQTYLNCLKSTGEKLQQFIGYKDMDNSIVYLFGPDIQARLSIYNTSFADLVFIDNERNALVSCLLSSDGTGISEDYGNATIIHANDVIYFPSTMKLNGVSVQSTSLGNQDWPYVWASTGYFPNFSGSSSLMHILKMNKSGNFQYLASSNQPRNSDVGFSDLVNLISKSMFTDIVTIERWTTGYGIRKYWPFADIHSDSLFSYCVDSTDLMRFKGTFTNDCWLYFKAYRKNRNNTWDIVNIKKFNGENVNDTAKTKFQYASWNQASEDLYIDFKLDLPIEDYALGGQVKMVMKMFPEYYVPSENQKNNIQKEYIADVKKTCLPRPGGCPFLYVKDSNKNYQADNNVLLTSEFSGSNDVIDKYMLRIKPDTTDKTITLALVENENDNGYINQVKLYVVDYPNNKKLGVTSSNVIVMYDSTAVTASDSVMLDNLNITSNVNYFNPGTPKNGFKNDSLYAHFSYLGGPELKKVIENLDSKQIDVKLKENNQKRIDKKIDGPGPGSSQPNFAFISDLSNLINPIPSTKDTGGVLTAKSIYSNTITKVFYRREKSSVVVLPLFGDSNKVRELNTKWQSDFRIKNLGIADLQYDGFTVTEVPLNKAYYTTLTLDSNIKPSIIDVDTSYGLVNSSALLRMYFDISGISNPSRNTNRAYIFEVTGYYTAGTDNELLSKSKNEVPFRYKLSQNYPNPFNPTTKINYEIAKDSRVKLIIYDILGREVKRLVDNDLKQAGHYIVDFDGTNLASGVYFYHIEAGTFIQSKKMVLVK